LSLYFRSYGQNNKILYNSEFVRKYRIVQISIVVNKNIFINKTQLLTKKTTEDLK